MKSNLFTIVCQLMPVTKQSGKEHSVIDSESRLRKYIFFFKQSMSYVYILIPDQFLFCRRQLFNRHQLISDNYRFCKIII